jgi:HAD superfamily hydrolase (TIGR01509 family)
MFKALVFDFDGLIMDTETYDFQAWREIYAGYGAELPADLWAKGVGVSTAEFDPVHHLERHVGRPVDLLEAKAKYRERFYSLLESIEPLPGVVELISEAKQRGIRLGVASSAPLSWVHGHLTNHGLKEKFETVRCCEHVERAKPAPDLYRLACADLGTEPRKAIALEDSPNGVLAAKRAGMYCVAVPNSVTASLSLDHADLILPSLASITLDQLFESLSAMARLEKCLMHW